MLNVIMLNKTKWWKGVTHGVWKDSSCNLPCVLLILDKNQIVVISKHTFWKDIEHCPKIINANEATFPYFYLKFQTTSYDLVHKLCIFGLRLMWWSFIIWRSISNTYRENVQDYWKYVLQSFEILRPLYKWVQTC